MGIFLDRITIERHYPRVRRDCLKWVPGLYKETPEPGLVAVIKSDNEGSGEVVLVREEELRALAPTLADEIASLADLEGEEFQEGCIDLVARVVSPMPLNTSIEPGSPIYGLGLLSQWEEMAKAFKAALEVCRDYDAWCKSLPAKNDSVMHETQKARSLERVVKKVDRLLQLFPIKQRLFAPVVTGERIAPALMLPVPTSAAAWAAGQLADLLRDHDYHWCCKCGKAGPESLMSCMTKVKKRMMSLQDRADLNLPEFGPVWLHNPAKLVARTGKPKKGDTAPYEVEDCYNSIRDRLERKWAAEAKGRQPGGKGGRPRKTEKTPEGV